MATKTIAVELSVYERLAQAKRESESFTQTIDRLLVSSKTPRTCAQALRDMMARREQPLSDKEAAVFERVVTENRAGATWPLPDLR